MTVQKTTFSEWHFQQEWVLDDVLYTSNGFGKQVDNSYKLLWKAVKDHIDNFNTCVDIGIGLGEFSRYASQSFDNIIGFDPLNVENITYNVPQEKLAHYAVAVNDTETVDSYNINNVGLLKVTVKVNNTAQEHLILKGCENILNNQNPVVLVDIHQADEDNLAIDYLTSLGYSQILSFGNIKGFKK